MSGVYKLKALVTGGCGFVGSHLVDTLVMAGYDVTVIDDLSSGSKEWNNASAKYVYSDFADVMASFISSSKQELKDQGMLFDVVFHLAACARIQPSFEAPHYTYKNNAFGTAIVAEFCRNQGCKVVYSGSSSCYAGVYNTPYGFAKWQGEEVLKMYSSIFSVSTAIVRFFNVYGPRNPLIGEFTPVVAKFETQHSQGKPLTIVGDGEQRRDFTHIDDICSGLLAISKGEWSGEIFNLGSGKNYSIKELAHMFGGEVEHVPTRRGEADTTLADISKTTELTGWVPKRSLPVYISEVVGRSE